MGVCASRPATLDGDVASRDSQTGAGKVRSHSFRELLCSRHKNPNAGPNRYACFASLNLVSPQKVRAWL